ncbi:MAG TPA: hypothetical protein VI895_08000 [Bdellovibrionota bacterium]|nr:hypothetical protein [Bdellovibrionota bacterium]
MEEKVWFWSSVIGFLVSVAIALHSLNAAAQSFHDLEERYRRQLRGADGACTMLSLGRASLSLSDVLDGGGRMMARALPATHQLNFAGAPLGTIGKLTRYNDSGEAAICSGVLIYQDVIFTSAACVDNNNRQAHYFFPGSESSRRAPFGSAHIVRWWYQKDGDFAVARLDRRLPVETINTRNCAAVFPESWRNGHYWNMAGYTYKNQFTPQLETGCRITAADAKHVWHDCEEDDDTRFLDGSPIFAELCGDWYVVAMATNLETGRAVRTRWVWDTVEKAFAEWGYGTEPATHCQAPTVRRPQARFEDPDMPTIWGLGRRDGDLVDRY